MDDCFSSKSALEKLAPHFKVESFSKWFSSDNDRREQGVKDPRVISFCHKQGWLLVTTDHEMRHTHVEEIKAHPHVTIIATARNSAQAGDHLAWINALIMLKPKILRYFKNSERPWFATFSREGNISSFHVIDESYTTRRSRKK